MQNTLLRQTKKKKSICAFSHSLLEKKANSGSQNNLRDHSSLQEEEKRKNTHCSVLVYIGKIKPVSCRERKKVLIKILLGEIKCQKTTSLNSFTDTQKPGAVVFTSNLSPYPPPPEKSRALKCKPESIFKEFPRL